MAAGHVWGAQTCTAVKSARTKREDTCRGRPHHGHAPLCDAEQVMNAQNTWNSDGVGGSRAVTLPVCCTPFVHS